MQVVSELIAEDFHLVSAEVKHLQFLEILTCKALYILDLIIGHEDLPKLGPVSKAVGNSSELVLAEVYDFDSIHHNVREHAQFVFMKRQLLQIGEP